MVLMTATNLFSVSSYGEFEFWFAGIKVAAIVLFLLLGSMYAFGLWPHRHADLSNLHAHGGFFPNGLPRRLRLDRGRDLFDGRCGDRDHCRRRIPRSAASGPASDQRRRRPHPDILCRLSLSAHRVVAVELRAARLLAIRGRVQADRNPRRRSSDERRRADRGAVVSQLRVVQRVPGAVRARR